MIMLIRRFRQFVNRKRNGGRRNFKKMIDELDKREKGNESKRNPITCYKCKKPNHNKIVCPLLRKKK